MTGPKGSRGGVLAVALVLLAGVLSGRFGWGYTHQWFVVTMTAIGGASTTLLGIAVIRIIAAKFEKR